MNHTAGTFNKMLPRRTKQFSRSAISREWMDLRGCTAYAAISERTLRAWMHAPVDPLPSVQVGRKILVKRTDFDAWLERHKIKPVDVGTTVDEILSTFSGRP